jgi:hypothetical protein
MTMSLQEQSLGVEGFSVARLRMLVNQFLAADENSPEKEWASFCIDQFGFDQTVISSLLVKQCDFTDELARMHDDPDSTNVAATRYLLQALHNHCCESFLDYFDCFCLLDDEKAEYVLDFAKAVFADGPVSRVLQPTREDRLRAAQVLGGRLRLGLTEISRLLGLSRGAVYRALKQSQNGN